jgi:hypothetical protein
VTYLAYLLCVHWRREKNALARAGPQRDIWTRHTLLEKGMVRGHAFESGRVVLMYIRAVSVSVNAYYRCWSRAMEFPGALYVWYQIASCEPPHSFDATRLQAKRLIEMQLYRSMGLRAPAQRTQCDIMGTRNVNTQCV